MKRNYYAYTALVLLTACGGNEGAAPTDDLAPTEPRFSFEGATGFTEVDPDGYEEGGVCLQPQGDEIITGSLDFPNSMEYQQGDMLYFSLSEVDGGLVTLLATKCAEIGDTNAQSYSFEFDSQEIDPELTTVLMVKYQRRIGEDIYQPLGGMAEQIITSRGQQVVPDVNLHLELFEH